MRIFSEDVERADIGDECNTTNQSITNKLDQTVIGRIYKKGFVVSM